jgi:arsenate reductase-like glutaredoxin family protein
MPLKVDWYYHRKNCQTCARSLAYLQRSKAQISEQADARKVRLKPSEALRLARTADQLWVAKGKKVVHLDLREDPVTDAQLKSLLIGPSGYLRAPTIVCGQRLFVGFAPSQFPQLLT